MPDPDPAPRQQVEDTIPSAPPDDLVAVEFARFYRETAPALVRFLVLQGARAADAADIAQDTLISAYTHWHKITTNPRAWSFRTASRGWIRHAVDTSHEELAADPPHSPLLGAIPTDGWHLRHELITALAALPERQRQIMAWTLSGYTPTEIAEELRLTSDQVRANLRLARHALATHRTIGEA
jgi:RNA polymerase sigma-70 factor (ECF subfamily)